MMLQQLFKRLKFASDPPDRGYRHGNRHFIELRRVWKVYSGVAGDVVALRNIDLTINSGEFIAVVGKSGSGKSTLINMITAVDRPTSGEILVGNTAVHRLNEEQAAIWRGMHVGIVYQSFQLIPSLTVIENVMLPMDFCDTYPPHEFHDRALHLLEQVGIAEHAYKLPSAVSGGQQQRVAIARALANDPPLILADEPTGNLDSHTADAVFHLFETLVDRGKTIVLVTHDSDLARRVQRIITIADGAIVADTATMIIDRPPASDQAVVGNGSVSGTWWW